MTARSVERIKAEIAETRERVHARAVVEVEAEWQRKIETAEQEAAESRVWMQIHRERRATTRTATESAPDPATSQEDEMAVSTPDKKISATTPFSKESQLSGGKKKRSAHQRIQDEQAAVRDRKNSKKGIAPSAKNPKSPTIAERTTATNAKAAGKTNGKHEMVAENAAAAKKVGVRVKASSKYPGKFFVLVFGTRDRAMSGMFDSESAAGKAAKEAGLDVQK